MGSTSPAPRVVASGRKIVRVSLRLWPKGTQSPNSRPDSPKHLAQRSNIEPEIVLRTRFIIEGKRREGSERAL